MLFRMVGAGSSNPLDTCSLIKKRVKPALISSLRKAADYHKKFVKGTTMYPLDHNPGHGQLCMVSS